MLTTYTVENGVLSLRDGVQDTQALRRAVWIDLLQPTLEEERAVQDALNLEIPTREEMQEIESSSRLYREGDALVTTASFLFGADTGEFGSTPISFVLTGQNLVTVRYATPRAFSVFAARCQKGPTLLTSPDAAMLHLIEQIVDRLADILERIGADMDRASQATFRNARGSPAADKRDRDLKDALITLGQVGEVTSRASETLLGLSRILTFLTAEKSLAIRKENQGTIKTLVRDLRSLTEHANFLSNRATFLLDALLGMTNVEQTAIIKTFTVVSVALMPPTLIASIYGMNFQHMPELEWTLGYPLALLLMVATAVLPVWYFKRKGWL
ncbi:magnesium transporter CorA family protein [Sabulicella glaciei]|uniref:Magnesium transporter CorA family protein n=1 Tax=Sabulicella glaciei TaxID=2984948 RepID=A0ABT3NV58_9PROT|nr:magnesium transporter CorA family protein [Roseococcus sp. MDT2-1-1]MCW8085793.1 magnesium transporter CorA family protein [Roseococcus sp. MDT2-1-1]